MSDVAIVGGGPVGLFLASLLVQRGLQVTVLEQRAGDGGGHTRAIGIHPPALGALARIGLDGELIRRGVPIRHGVALAAGRTVARMSFDRVPGPYPFVLSLPQDRTEMLLERRLHELNPESLRRGVRVSAIHDDGHRVRLKTCQGGREAELLARLVIGADGIRSTARDASGIGLRSREYPDRYLMGDFADSTPFGADAALFLAPGGIVESFPLPGGQRRWVVRLNDHAAGAGASAADAAWLAGEVRRRTGIAVETASNSMVSAFGVRSRLARRMVAGRCLLIGDAAHEISPIGGQGMNLGWLDAVELAPLVPALLAGRDGGAEGFERRRLRAAARAVRQSEINMALGRPLRGGPLTARNRALAAAAAVPVINRLAARRFTMQ